MTDVAESRLDHAPCGFLSFTEDGNIRWANSTLAAMLGYESDTLIGGSVEMLLTVGSRIFYQTHLLPLLRHRGEVEEIFLMFRSRTGEEVGALLNAVRHERPYGTEFDCVVMRVKERQKFEDQLLKARKVAEDAKGEAEQRQRALAAANEDLKEKATELEFQQHQLHEQAVELEASTEELLTANDELLERTQEAEDLRALAEDASRAKSTFLAVMSHELRTPLNAIAGYVEILEMGVHGPVNEAQREALNRIARSERHLLRLINEVLNLAKIEAGHVQYDVETLDVAELIASVMPMVEPQLDAKGISHRVDIPQGLRVAADRDKIQQVLLNLLGNAAKFTLEGGGVSVTAETAGDEVIIRVADSGIGIAAEKLGSIFEPFVQVDASPSRGEEGSGLGLAISRDLTRGMHGDLTAESVFGSGSDFQIHLPVPAAS